MKKGISPVLATALSDELDDEIVVDIIELLEKY